MLKFTNFLLLTYVTRSLAALKNETIYLPDLKTTPNGGSDIFGDHIAYCFRMTWLGEKYDKTTFPEVMNKTCSEFFDKTNSRLCIDPMAVTFTGKFPDFAYVLNNHAQEATCKLSKDQVCAKYTIYFNGVASHVVRYCTRIDVDPEGSMQSGCLTETKGSYSYEICACISGKGVGAICNKAGYFEQNQFITLIFSFIVYILNANQIFA